mgnify:CR=1 FL=1
MNLSGITLTEQGCEYSCEGKQTKRGFRVYCRKVEAKCKPGGSPVPVPSTTTAPSPITMSQTEYIIAKRLGVIGRAMNMVKGDLAKAQTRYAAIPKHHTSKKAKALNDIQKYQQIFQKLENAKITRTAEDISEAINTYFNRRADAHSTVSDQISEPWLAYEHKKAVEEALQHGETVSPKALKDYPEFFVTSKDLSGLTRRIYL